VGSPLAVAEACSGGAAFARIAERARQAGGLLIHPYMSIEPVWRLAERVSSDASVEVKVIGPPPPVTWLANDKKSFCDLVGQVLGPGWLVPTTAARDVPTLARQMLELAASHPRVGLKRTRCASAMGNGVFRSEALLAAGAEGVERAVRDFLDRTEWDGSEETLVVAWADTDLSPSTQTWIPPRGGGAPRLDGIYEQILEGPERVFVGSRPSGLAPDVSSRLSEASLRMAAALQERGYVGRCSFDFLVLEDGRICFTECNGRWGGTSIPMSLVDRLVQGPRPPYRAQDFVHPGLVGATLPEILERVGDAAFDPRTGKGAYVFYNVGPLARSGKLDVIALGDTQDAAEEALVDGLPRRLGLS
jgi:hypothetical protein